MKMIKDKNKISLLGVQHDISFEKTKFTKPMVLKDSNILRVFKSELKRTGHKEILIDWLKDKSKKHITKRVQILAERYGFEYNNIAIRDQKTRWGSCSSKKNLNFNWKLILTPSSCLDYVIIHELSHTKQMNHSKNFWALVEQIMPTYKQWEKWLNNESKRFF